MLTYYIGNKEKYISDLHMLCGEFHDSILETFNYSKVQNEVTAHLINKYYDTEYRMKFRDVKMFFSVNFGIWGINSERLLEVDTVKCDTVIRSLKELNIISYALKNSNTSFIDEHKFSLMVNETLGMKYLFATGNEIFILSESIEIEKIM